MFLCVNQVPYIYESVVQSTAVEVERTLQQQWLTIFPLEGNIVSVHLCMHHAPSWENTDKPAAAWLPARQIHSLNKSRLGWGHIADLYSSTNTLPAVNLHGVR